MCDRCSMRHCTPSSIRWCFGSRATDRRASGHSGHEWSSVGVPVAEIVAPIALMLGANPHVATRMNVPDSRYTGAIDFYCTGETRRSRSGSCRRGQRYAIRGRHASRTPSRNADAAAVGLTRGGWNPPGPASGWPSTRNGQCCPSTYPLPFCVQRWGWSATGMALARRGGRSR